MIKGPNSSNRQGLEKQRWRQHFQSLIKQHRGVNHCFPERFKWGSREGREAEASFEREDAKILRQLKNLLFSQPEGSLCLSYFPRCDEVDIRPLWQDLPHLHWAFPTFSSYTFQFRKGPNKGPVHKNSISSSSSIFSSSSSSSSRDEEGVKVKEKEKKATVSFFQVPLYPLYPHLMMKQMQGASYCPLQETLTVSMNPSKTFVKRLPSRKLLVLWFRHLPLTKKDED